MNELLEKITLQELEIFSEVGQRKSLRSVARRRNLSPSHISKILKRLEKKMGAELIKRSASGVTLTPHARNLLSTADSILEQARSLNTSSNSKVLPPTLMSIGAVSFLASKVVSVTLEPLMQIFPNYRFRIIETTPDHLSQGGVKGIFESAVHVGELEWPRTWETLKIGEIQWKLFARKSHPLKKKSTKAEVCEYAFVVPNFWTPEGFVVGNDHCPLSWTERKKGIEISSALNALEVILNTDQVSYLPDVIVRDAVARKELKEIHVKEWKVPDTRPVYLSVRADAVSKKFQTQFASFLKRALSA